MDKLIFIFALNAPEQQVAYQHADVLLDGPMVVVDWNDWNRESKENENRNCQVRGGER